jgi:hypothetical protein
MITWTVEHITLDMALNCEIMKNCEALQKVYDVLLATI